MTAYGSQTVDRALLVLDIVSSHEAPLSLSEIAAESGLNISTASRMLRSLQQHGYVRRDRLTGQYRLGYKLLHMANILREQAGLHDIANSALEELVLLTGETATLDLVQEGQDMVVLEVGSLYELRMVINVGSRRPLHCTASGKVLLAFLSDDRVDEIMSRELVGCAARTIIDPTAMRVELAGIRDRGYAISLGEYEDILASVAAPVRDMWGVVIASCAIWGPAPRIESKEIAVLSQHVTNAARKISERIGWKP